MIKNCAHCSGEFTTPPSLARIKYCSRSCYDAARKGNPIAPPKERTCARCGRQYKSYALVSEFCSRKCRDQQVEKKCIRCGTPFMAKESHADRRKYCSKPCARTGRTEISTEMRKCAHCTNDFEVLRYKDTKYCSITCMRAGMGNTQRAIRKDKPHVLKERNWYTNKDGYLYTMRTASGVRRLVFQHRELMEGILGRPLHRWENIHHKNGQRSDNRSENLELWVKKQPPGKRHEDLIAWMIDYLSAAGYTIQGPVLVSPA